MAFEFLQHAPSDPLDGLVESLWFAWGTMPYARELIAPTGSTVVVCILGPPMVVTAEGAEPVEFVDGYVLGPHDRPVVNEPTGETVAAGIVTTPVGCRAALGFDPAPLRGSVCSLRRAPGWVATLPEAVSSGDDARSVVESMEAVVLAHLGPVPPSVVLVRTAIEHLADDPATSIASLAAEMGVSPGQLHRVMVHVVGLSPVAVRRILRMRQLLDVADDPLGGSWTTLATRFGWYDQSHFTRDFRRHTGVTPSEYRQSRLDHLDPEDRTPGFVPRP